MMRPTLLCRCQCCEMFQLFKVRVRRNLRTNRFSFHLDWDRHANPYQRLDGQDGKKPRILVGGTERMRGNTMLTLSVVKATGLAAKVRT